MSNIDRAAEVISLALADDADVSIDGNYNNIMDVSEATLDGKYDLTAVARSLADAGLLADEHHSTAELYDYRMAYNALLFNEWTRARKHDVHKSWRHSDGELCFGGDWFIVCATTPHGLVSNHYHSSNWHYFDIPEREVPVEYDGHTPAEALRRLMDTADDHYDRDR